MKFKLTLEFPSTRPVGVVKEFNIKNVRTGWLLAKQWENECLVICGKNELNEEFNRVELERID